MLKTALLTTSCAMFIGSVAFAQTSDTTATPNTAIEQPAQTSVTMQNMFGNPPSNTASDANKIGFVDTKAGQLLVSSFIGQTIYESDANEAASVGKLNDLITNSDGQIEAAVIGVGGFLGVGEKDVAVTPDQLQLAERSDGKKWLVIKVTKEALNAAPAFDRSTFFTDGVADPNAAQIQSDSNATTAPASPAPTLNSAPDSSPAAPNNAPPTAP